MAIKQRVYAAALAVALMLCLLPGTAVSASKVSMHEFGDNGLGHYLRAQRDGVSWVLLAAIDLYEGNSLAQPDAQKLASRAALLAERAGQSERNQLKAYNESSSARTKIQDQISRLSGVASIVKDKRFPLDAGTRYFYENTWHAPRGNTGERQHIGIDIIADKGVEIKSVCAGTIEKIGWNDLGGYRIGIRGKDGIYYYYAHMSAYAKGMKVGVSIKQGQVIGYVGSTGYGPEGTDNIMIPHLHFGMYTGKDSTLQAFNPYDMLRHWEAAR